MTEHTPGPWEWVDGPEYGYSALWNPETHNEVLTADGFNDGDRPITWMGEDLTLADKVLITAAPDMLSLLKQLVELDWFEDSASMQDLVAEVIAKAEGKD